ncbi:MAG: lipoprotein, partial [Bacteroidia bacterium]
MKKLLILASFVAVVTGCNSYTGELVGVKNRESWYQPDPFGMLYIPLGSFHM